MKILRNLLIALLLCASVASFGEWRAAATNDGYSRTLQEANAHKILLITVGSEPRTLDPQEAQGVTEQHIIMAMIEGLVAPSIDDQSKVVAGNTTPTILFGHFTLGRTENGPTANRSKPGISSSRTRGC